MKSKILIIEDESIEAMNFEQYLNSIGYEVVGIVSNGEDAINKAASLKPDLVLMDIVLKGDMDGIEVAGQIKEYFDIPVVYITAHPEQSAIDRAKVTTPYGYLIKPVSKTDLKNTIELALYKHKMESKLIESEVKYRTLFNLNPLCTIALSLDGQILDANIMVENITGLKREEIIGKNPFEVGIFPLEDIMDHKKRLKSILNNEEISPYICQITINNQKRWLKSIFTPIMRDNQINSILIIFEDITANKNAENTIRLNEERYRMLFENSQVSTAITSIDGKLITANEKFLEMVDCRREELGELDLRTMYQDINQRNHIIETLKNGKKIREFEVDLVRKDGSRYINSINVDLIRYQGEDAMLVTAVDITERKTAEKLLRENEKILKIEKGLAFDLSKSTEIIDILNICLDAVINISGMDSGGIYLVDDKSGDLVLKVHSGLNDNFIDSVKRYKADSNNTRIVMEGQSIYNNYEEFKIPISEAQLKEKIRAFASIPIKYQGNVIAALNLASHTINEISDKNKKALKSILGQIGGAIIRSKVESALKESETKYRNIFENSVEGIFQSTPEGKYRSVNPAFVQMAGFESSAEMMGKVNDIKNQLYANPKDRTKLKELMEKYGRVKNFEAEIIRKDKKKMWVSINANAIKNDEGKIIYYDGTTQDITDRINAEKALKESYNKYQSLIETNVDFIWELDTQGRYTYCSPQMEKLWGLIPEKMIGNTPFDLMPIDQRDNATKQFMETINSNSPFSKLEIESYDSNGNLIFLEISGVPFFDENGLILGYRGSTRDITENKKAESDLIESEKRFRMLFNRSNAIMLLIEPDFGKIIDANSSASLFYGYPLETMKSMSVDELNQLPPDEIADIRKKIRNEEENYFVLPHKLINGEIRTVEVYSTPIIFKDGVLLFSIIHDITQRKKAENKIKSSLKEKEILLKEIHHRVKNNLQIISSLLDLQEDYVSEDTTAVNVLKESQNRVISMAMIHEMIYQSEDLSRINFSDYIINLTSNLFDSYGVKSNINSNIKVDQIYLNIETSVSLGLIISELVSNSIKYAFPNDEEGEISICLSYNDEKFELTISDNGVGLPKKIDFNTESTLGLRLVKSLINQLNGTINLKRSPGTKYTIIFKELKYKQRF